jgi:hypothetical protein
MSTNPISTQYDMAKRVLQMLEKQQEYFEARRNKHPMAGVLLKQCKLMEKDLREECARVIRLVESDLAKMREWNARQK